MSAAASTPGWLARVRALPNESTAKIVLVTLAVCVVASLLVSTAAVLLEPAQRANQALERKRKILEVARLLPAEDAGRAAVEAAFARVETRLVDLASGRFVAEPDQAGFDQRAAARDPARRVLIPRERDIAGIGARARYANAYLVREEGRVSTLILPVHGLGLWSTLYGFIALAGDLDTVIGLGFYEHGETPGLGAEVDNPRWRAGWDGKRVFGPQGEVRIEVAKGEVADTDPRAAWRVDGIAGATLTTRGVSNMLRYWLGEQGYGPLLARLRAGEQ